MKTQRNRFWFLPLAAVFVTLAVMFGCDKEKLTDSAHFGQEMDGGISSDLYPLSIPDGERFLIGFHKEPDINIVRGVGGEVYKTFTIVPAIAARLSPRAVEALEKNPNIRYVEPDHEVFAHSQTVPWGIDRVFGDESYSFQTWTTTKGLEMKVAILDTGIDEKHEDLTVAGGITTVDDTHWGSDISGHGTHVAGTVAALDNTLGVVGVAPGVALYAVKVLSDGGSGSVSSVVGGIEWAVGKGIPVLNMSLGSSTSSQTLEAACSTAYAAGHLLVASAGNSGNPGGRGDNVGFPAAYASVIAVAASTANNTRASYSSTGPAVELIAPGSSIFSTEPNDNYGTKSGTSMASPHVAGVAALAWSADILLTNIQIRTILQETAEDLGLSLNHQGHGLARADLAVRAVAGVEPPPPATTYTVSGTVTDTEGYALAGVTVTIKETGQSSETGDYGTYSIPDVKEGTYDITASKEGYNSQTTNVKVDSNTLPVDFVLQEKDETVSPLSIDKFILTNTSNPAWARVTVDWAVSGSNLETVKSELSLNGNLIDSVTSSVSGSGASGSHELRNRGGSGETYEIKLTVTDTAGNFAVKSDTIRL
jgi:subtilisin